MHFCQGSPTCQVRLPDNVQLCQSHTAPDTEGARRIVDDWLREHGDNVSDCFECLPDIRDDLERRIGLALGSARMERK